MSLERESQAARRDVRIIPHREGLYPPCSFLLGVLKIDFLLNPLLSRRPAIDPSDVVSCFSGLYSSFVPNCPSETSLTHQRGITWTSLRDTL